MQMAGIRAASRAGVGDCQWDTTRLERPTQRKLPRSIDSTHSAERLNHGIRLQQHRAPNAPDALHGHRMEANHGHHAARPASAEYLAARFMVAFDR
tara:strand:- start:133 stop:420 length:288 start_codon:yes stop_codon:yes gene_type:complete